MQPILSISQSELAADPNARFWALVLYLAGHPEEQTRPELQQFWLAYSYDAEVLNGGHLQYFHNRGTKDVARTIDALHEIGAKERAALLTSCWHQVQKEPVSRVTSLEEYSSLAAERSFKTEDTAYYAVKPDLMDLLEKYYAQLLLDLVAVST